MNSELVERVKRGIGSGRTSVDIQSELVSQGFIEDEVQEAIQSIRGLERSVEDKQNIRVFTFKEVFDRVGYGFASIQFVNILFYLIGANFFIIGLVNGLKAILSLWLSSVLQEYAKVKQITTKFMSKAGILFGFSFLLLAAAITTRSVALFSFAVLLGAVGVVTYGDLYERLAEIYLKKEKLGKFLLNISHFGVIITGLAMVLSGLLFDRFPILSAERITLFGKSLPLFGYLICFEITAISFILSGYVLHFVKEKNIGSSKVKNFFKDYFFRVRSQHKIFFQNKYLVLLLLAGSITGLVQILTNTYYGIYLYQKFEQGAFQGLFDGIFLNISFIFLFAIVVSFLGPAFSEFLNKKVGLAPSMVFGSLLLAIPLLVAVYNPRFMPLFFANAVGVLGGAILGMGQGLLVRKLVRDEQRNLYYAVMTTGVIGPFLILMPLGAFLAQWVGLVMLFQILSVIIILLAAPTYFVLVLMANKKRI
jgi:hypothetical protein